jgi:hypothetical protein
MIILETLSRTKLHNEAHFQFNTEIRHLVLEKTNAALGTGEAYKDFNRYYEQENDALEHERKSVYTDKIKEHDHQRDLAYGALRRAIKAQLELPGTESRHDKAQALLNILDKYKKPSAVSYGEESGTVENLLEDLSGQTANDYVVALKLEDFVTALTGKNGEFVAAYRARVKEQSVRPKYDMREIRKNLDGAADSLLQVVVGGAARETYKGVFVDFIAQYNEFVKKYRTMLKQQGGRSKGGIAEV